MLLKLKTAKNISYIVVINFFALALNTVTLLILARLLSPFDFGIIAIALVVVNALNHISDFGLLSAIIYRQQLTPEVISTAFYLRLVFSIVAYLIISLTLPYWAIFLGGEVIVDVIRLIALTPIITSVGFGSIAELNIKLDFRKIALVQALQVCAYAGLAIILAYTGFRFWALVYAQLGSWLLWTAVIYLCAPWKLLPAFDKKLSGELLGYAKHVLASIIVIFIIINMDRVIIAATLGPILLGFYDMAHKWATLGATQLTIVVNRVMFPTYSKVRKVPNLLKTAYIKTLHYVSSLTIPLAVGLIVIAPEFITYVLSEKWLPALLPLIILCIFGLCRAIAGNSGSIFKATGRPNILFNISILSLGLKLILIVLFIRLGYGIIGVAFAVASASIFITQLNVYYCCKLTNTHWQDIVHTLKPAVIATLFMCLAIYALKLFIEITGLIHVIFLVIFAIIIYFVVFTIISPGTIRELKELLSATVTTGAPTTSNR